MLVQNDDLDDIAFQKPTQLRRSKRNPQAIEHENDAVTGTGIFSHDNEEEIPYHLLLSRLYLQKDFYPSLNTFVKSGRMIPALHVVPERKRTTLGNFRDFCAARTNREAEHV